MNTTKKNQLQMNNNKNNIIPMNVDVAAAVADASSFAPSVSSSSSSSSSSSVEQRQQQQEPPPSQWDKNMYDTYVPPLATPPPAARIAALERETEELLRHSLDDDLSDDYKQAWADAPQLVDSESPTIAFLRTDNYDAARAALRLAWYWKYRKIVFGKDRWLLPLTQTGTGALCAEAVEMLRTPGFFVWLCDPTSKTPYHAVDVSKWPRPLKRNPTLECIFYFGTVGVGSNEYSQTVGYTHIHIVNQGHRLSAIAGIGDMVRDAFPIKTRQSFAIPVVDDCDEEDEHNEDGCGDGTDQTIQNNKEDESPGGMDGADGSVTTVAVADQGGSSKYKKKGGNGGESAYGVLRDYLTYQAERMMQHNHGTNCLVLKTKSAKSRLAALRAAGFDRACLPATLGGEFGDQKWADWIRMRISIEDIMGAAPPTINATLCNHKKRRLCLVNGEGERDAKFTSNQPVMLTASSSSAPFTATSTSATPVTLTRAKRRRQQEKQNIATLQEKSRLEKDRNVRLRHENSTLVKLVEQAKLVVSMSSLEMGLDDTAASNNTNTCTNQTQTASPGNERMTSAVTQSTSPAVAASASTTGGKYSNRHHHHNNNSTNEHTTNAQDFGTTTKTPSAFSQGNDCIRYIMDNNSNSPFMNNLKPPEEFKTDESPSWKLSPSVVMQQQRQHPPSWVSTQNQSVDAVETAPSKLQVHPQSSQGAAFQQINFHAVTHQAWAATIYNSNGNDNNDIPIPLHVSAIYSSTMAPQQSTHYNWLSMPLQGDSPLTTATDTSSTHATNATARLAKPEYKPAMASMHSTALTTYDSTPGASWQFNNLSRYSAGHSSPPMDDRALQPMIGSSKGEPEMPGCDPKMPGCDFPMSWFADMEPTWLKE